MVRGGTTNGVASGGASTIPGVGGSSSSPSAGGMTGAMGGAAPGAGGTVNGAGGTDMGTGGTTFTGDCMGQPAYNMVQATGDVGIFTCTIAQATCSSVTVGEPALFECIDSHLPNCQGQDPQGGTNVWRFIDLCSNLTGGGDGDGDAGDGDEDPGDGDGDEPTN